MGGGRSNLFFGTKGAKSEYQFTLFPDDEKPKRKTRKNIEGNSIVGDISSLAETAVRTQDISVEMVLQKCQDYWNEELNSDKLVAWLSHIYMEPRYKMQSMLKSIIGLSLKTFSHCITDSGKYDVVEFEIALKKLENSLEKLL